MCHHSTSFQLSRRIIMTTRYQVQLTQDDDIKSAYELLLWDHSHIYFQDYSIAFQDIQEINISMCSMMQMLNILSIYMNYYVDINIITPKEEYAFQIMNHDTLLSFFETVSSFPIPINDPLHILQLYTDTPDNYARTKYLDRHFKKWAQQYHLDNPRGKCIPTQFSFHKKS